MSKNALSSVSQQTPPTVGEKVEGESCQKVERLDPRVLRTRKLLEDALKSLLAERPYSEISISDIAERATVNRSTFYAHYVDKHDLATRTLRREFETALRGTFTSRPVFGAENLGKVAVTVFEFMGQAFAKCPKMGDDLAPTAGQTMQDVIQTFIRQWIDRDPEAKRLFPSAAKDAVATMVAWTLFGAAYRWSHEAKRPPVRKATEEVVFLLIR